MQYYCIVTRPLTINVAKSGELKEADKQQRETPDHDVNQVEQVETTLVIEDYVYCFVVGTEPLVRFCKHPNDVRYGRIPQLTISLVKCINMTLYKTESI